MKSLKFSLPALKPRNPFAALVRRRRAGKHRRQSVSGQQAVRDELEQWMHDIRSAGL